MFDPYHKWFGIPPKDQPPHYYRLLGLETFECDLDVIESAADRLMQFVRHYQSGEHAAAAARILNELAQARLCLLKPATKAGYDARLKNEIAARQSSAEFQNFEFAETATPVRKKKRKASGFPSHMLLVGGSGLVVCLGLILFLIKTPGKKSTAKQLHRQSATGKHRLPDRPQSRGNNCRQPGEFESTEPVWRSASVATEMELPW